MRVDGLFRSALRRAVIGFALGLLTGTGILCLTGPGALRGDLGQLALYQLSSSVYGAAVMGASVVYDVERWSVTRATLIHMLVTLGGLCLLGLAQGWLGPTLFGFVVPTIGCVVLYAVIWLIQYLSLRRRIEHVNLKLRMRRRDSGVAAPSREIADH